MDNFLDSLLGDNISAKTENLAEYTAKNTVRVRAHVGRNRGIVPLPEKQLGMKPGKLGQNGQAFYAGHMQAGRLCLIPQADEQRLGRLEARLRCAIKGSEVFEGLIPVARYASLKTEFEEIRKDYFDARDDVLARWDSLVAEFKLGCKEMLDGVRMQKRNRELLYKSIVASIPSKGEYERSFSMSLEVTAFPASGVPDGLDESIAADVESSWKGTVVSTALKAIETTVGEGFAMLGKAASAYAERGSIGGKTLDAMERYSQDMVWKNVFQNTALTACANKCGVIANTMGADAKESLVEEAILDIWDYAKATGLHLDASVTPFTPDVLDAMLDVRKKAAAQQASLFEAAS